MQVFINLFSIDNQDDGDQHVDFNPVGHDNIGLVMVAAYLMMMIKEVMMMMMTILMMIMLTMIIRSSVIMIMIWGMYKDVKHVTLGRVGVCKTRMQVLELGLLCLVWSQHSL